MNYDINVEDQRQVLCFQLKLVWNANTNKGGDIHGGGGHTGGRGAKRGEGGIKGGGGHTGAYNKSFKALQHPIFNS